MNSTDLISVIVPIHNTVSYLHDCIVSIVKQTYENIEIICVDDHSDDETARALDKESRRDKRIRIIRLDENLGAGEARNTGMRRANGDYLMFLDSDDLYEPEMIEILHDTISKNNADICVCSFDCFDGLTGEPLYEFRPKTVKGMTGGCFKLSQLGEDGLTIYNTAPWNKIFRKQYLDDKKLFFQSLSSSNDVSFVYRASLKANSIVYSDNRRALAHYRVNTGTQISANKKSMNLYRAVKHVLNEMGDEVSELSLRQIVYAYIMLAVYELRECKDDKINREFYDCTQALINDKAKHLRFNDPVADDRLKRFMALDYESNWFGRGNEFYERIKANYEMLADVLNVEDNILIWGNGEKSNSLQRVLRERGFGKVNIADIKNSNVGERTESGYMIVDYLQALKCNRKIVASNRSIYSYLTQKGYRCIDLDDYCEERNDNKRGSLNI